MVRLLFLQSLYKLSDENGGLGKRARFDAVSQQLQGHGHIPRGGQLVAD